MKKILAIFIVLFCTLLLSSCGSINKNEDFEKCKNVNFELLCEHKPGVDDSITYYRDTDTNIIYFKWYDGGHGYSLSVYYNSKGEVMTYKEFEREHKHEND